MKEPNDEAREIVRKMKLDSTSMRMMVGGWLAVNEPALLKTLAAALEAQKERDAAIVETLEIPCGLHAGTARPHKLMPTRDEYARAIREGKS